MKGFKDSSGKFHPIKKSKGIRKSRNQKAKRKGVKIRKGRWDDTRFIVMKVGDPTLGSKEFKREAHEKLHDRDYFETETLGQAIQAVDEGRGNVIMDKDTSNIMDETLQ